MEMRPRVETESADHMPVASAEVVHEPENADCFDMFLLVFIPLAWGAVTILIVAACHAASRAGSGRELESAESEESACRRAA